MPGFKAQVKRDLKTVFHNPDEHADIMEVEYNGRKCKIPLVVDHEGARERQQPSSDHAGGIFIADMTVYVSLYDLKIVPRKETSITIDGYEYNIVKVGCDAGEITLDLELMDE